MRPKLLIVIMLVPVIACQQANPKIAPLSSAETPGLPGKESAISETIEDIPVPPGFKRLKVPDNSFADWIRKIRLKKDARVFLFDGSLKHNQGAQFAVLDIPVGKKDLQQCADAVMRLRASFLLHHRRFNEISFADNNGTQYRYADVREANFEKYLERVFAHCGTLSLERQLKKVKFDDMQIGDVLIKGGSPGHAVIITDMAMNAEGEKVFLLSQSYMPAQDIHILKNPVDSRLSPWYALEHNVLIDTPEWDFKPEHLRRW